MPSATGSDVRIVAELAIADLRHEWVLALCMVLAVAAVLAPLLLLLGLKHGTIENLRARLVEDPVYREIKPNRTLNLPPQWFDRWKQRKEVVFLLPTILRGASVVRAYRMNSREHLLLDLIPTGPGDPLILENQGMIPEEGRIVLSSAAAEALGGRQGDILTLDVDRTRRGTRESQEVRMTVASVLPPKADDLPRIYAPLDFAVAVETYREGMAVPRYGWPGGAPAVFPSFDGLMVLTQTPMDRLALGSLRIGTGFSVAEPLPLDAVRDRVGIGVPDGWTAYDLRTVTKAATQANIKQIQRQLRGQEATLIPYVLPRTITVGGTPLRVVGQSLDLRDAEQLGVVPPPWGGIREPAEGAHITQILLPNDAVRPGPETMAATVRYGDHTVEFPLTRIGEAPVATVPLELLAVLRTGDDRKIVWDEAERMFLLSRSGFFGFRMYARSIDDVVPVYRDLVSEGIDVTASVQDIERIRILDQGLTRLFWLVATVGISGGFAALAASLYGAVERKKRDLGVMRLMGLSRHHVFGFPIYQGIALAIGSVVVATLAFLTLSAVINRVFAGELRLGQRIADLPPEQFVLAAVATVAAAVVSSLYAARTATRIEPAEAIRAE